MLGLLAVVGAGVLGSCFSERATGTATSCNGTTVPCVVEIRDFAFRPSTLRVPAGASVTWINREQQAGLAHTTTSDGAGWDSGLLAPNGSFSRTFSASGSFPYHCEPHPTMTATIIVE